MKKHLTFLVLTACSLIAAAQQELRIHHINVDDGDATLIGIYDTGTAAYTKTILIDGGSASPAARLLPYLQKTLNSPVPKLDYLALTHYHEDHYNGLLAIDDGGLRADSVIDQGGYPIGNIFPAQAALGTTEQKPAAMEVFEGWTTALKTALGRGYLKGHVTGFFHYGQSPQTNLGRKLTLGSIQGIPVTIECVAGWGNTLNGSGITPDPSPTRKNPNNFSLAFVLSYGQFRYFIGGDLGGDRHSPYIDQESPLTAYLNVEYPIAWSWNHGKQAAGHICGFKANHHGSEHSNSLSFMSGMSPAICVTSAGNQGSWKLPRPGFLEGYNQVIPLSVWTATASQTYSSGLYITNLFDFNGVASKTKAIELFAGKPGTSFSYGNAGSDTWSGYMIKVPANGISHKSQFQVYRSDNAGATLTLLANYFCHTD